MNTEQLRETLDLLAGPPPPPTASARTAIATRVARTRRRIGALSGALVLVAGIVTVGLLGVVLDRDQGGDVVMAGGPAGCTRLPRAARPEAVPPEVRRWADGAPVVGRGSLWTVRRLLVGTASRDGSVERLKIGWFVVPAGPAATAPTITARERGGTGRVTGSAGLATDANGTWFASTIELPTTGACWEITARHEDDTIGFRRRAGN